MWTRVDSIHAEGPSAQTAFRLELPDLRRENLLHFLPLWSREVTPARAEKLFARLAAEDGYSTPFGLRFVPASDPAAGQGNRRRRVDGMEPADGRGGDPLRQGEIWRWSGSNAGCGTLALSLRTDRSFRSCYSAASGAGEGPRNSLRGIFPVGLFLAALGVHPVSSNRVWVGGRSIFPFPVTSAIKGMSLIRMEDTLQVEFPSGRAARLSRDPAHPDRRGAGVKKKLMGYVL